MYAFPVFPLEKAQAHHPFSVVRVNFAMFPAKPAIATTSGIGFRGCKPLPPVICKIDFRLAPF